MIYLFLVVFACHYLFLLMLILGWQKASTPTGHKPDCEASRISVVVPFRNEEANIKNLVRDLSRQTHSSFEVIFVDDQSEDGSVAIVSREIAGKRDFTLISSHGEGKKRAITTGVSAAKGNIIAVTDADCSIPPHWLRLIESRFRESGVKMIYGGVRISPRPGVFSSWQELEFCSVLGTGVALHAWNMPVYCNGANMAFTREAFIEVDGYAGNLHIASGDDEFLLKKISGLDGGGVRFLNDPGAVVETPPHASLGELFHQRIRWAGKWKHTPGAASRVAAPFVFIVQITFICLIVLLFLGWHVRLVSFLLLGKSVLEFVFLFNVATFLRARMKLSVFLLLQFTYPFYVVAVGLLANGSRYVWKGRKLRSKASIPG